jgi:DNA-binding transcriptional MocR family regulator
MPSAGVTASAVPLYARIAAGLSEQVKRGALQPGDRAPSLRRLSRQHRVSLSTAIQAYRSLEREGRLEARPKSGFFIRTPPAERIPEPAGDSRPARREKPLAQAVFDGMVSAINDPAFVPFGAGCVGPELFPNRQLGRIARRVIRRIPDVAARYVLPPGVEALRRQISRRAPDLGCRFAPDEILITNGAQEGLQIALHAVAEPGQAVAVESPTYFGAIDAARSRGLDVVEVPTHPRLGMDLDALARVLARRRIAAVLSMPNGHNPLGFVLPDLAKRALVELTARHGVPLIEDDIYGDLALAGPRPRAAKSFDREGLVILCGSFSKVLSPGLRVGWMAAGRFHGRAQRIKLTLNLAGPSLSQHVVAEFLAEGGYDRHVTRLRARLRDQMERARQAVARCFPEGTRVSRPSGGHMLWVELPFRTDAVAVFHDALAQRISVLPGPIFSPGRRFRNFLRLNAGHAWTETHERGLQRLGRICRDRR